MLSLLKPFQRLSVRRRRGEDHRKLMQDSGLFDADWYLSQYPDVNASKTSALDYYRLTGWQDGHSPSKDFDAPWYLKQNPDVRIANHEPLLHFLLHGAREGRAANALGLKLASESPLALSEVARLAILDAGPENQGPDSLQALLQDPLIGFIADESKGKSIVELGFRGVGSLELAVACLARGSKDFRIISYEIQADMSERLRRVAARVKCKSITENFLKAYPAQGAPYVWQPFWTEAVKDRWVLQAWLHERDIRNKLGSVEILVSTDNIFHAPDIIQALRRLAFVSQNYVIFDTTVVEPFETMINGTPVRFAEDDIWFAGGMSPEQIQAMAEYWRQRDVSLEQFSRFPQGMTRRQCDESGLGGVWWWFVGHEGIKKALTLAGMEMVKFKTMWGGRSVLVMARKAPI